MRILREPLLHFLLLGAILFALSFLWGGNNSTSTTPSDKTLLITPEQITLLKSGYSLDTGHPPTDAELQHLIDNYIREEILVREARAQGLDKDDSIIRRRLVQKMEFAVADPPTPPDSTLEQYRNDHLSIFRTTDDTAPPLSAIHAAVLSAWLNDQRKQASDTLYQNYRAQYHITIETPVATNPAGGAAP